MAYPNTPAWLPQVIGYAADVLPIPDVTPTGTGQLSYRDAWPPITGMPLEVGGIAPERRYFNTVYQKVTQHVYFQQHGAVYPWQNNADYLSGWHVMGSNGREYIAKAPSGPSVPGAGARNPIADKEAIYWYDFTAVVQGEGSGGMIPRGGICPVYKATFSNRNPIFWGQTKADANWLICDGGSDGEGGKVPDLSGKFIMGGGNASYPVGTSGGTRSHSHSISGTVGYTSLSENQIAPHVHPLRGWAMEDGDDRDFLGIWHGAGQNTDYTLSAGSTGGHTHSLGSGATGTANNLPPYYVLSYIVRMK